MACGVPTVVADTGELPQVVDQAGVVAPAADAHALAGVLQRLRDAPDRRKRLARAGRANVLARYTTQAVADATADFYRLVARDED